MSLVACLTCPGCDSEPSELATSSLELDASDGGTQRPIVTISEGELEGISDTGTYAFLGIPYARPPVGELRWQPPSFPEAWTGLRSADRFSAKCAQVDPSGAVVGDEDCLSLNVWTKDLTARSAPVMVFIHGGGNRIGSASEPLPNTSEGNLYSGATLAAEQAVVVVTLNYRLGALGFFAYPGLAGNQGLLDQRAALQWVQRNIVQFGGDPNNVMIFGESSGAIDVCCHMVSPTTRGLFQRAISQSGGCTTPQDTRAAAETSAQTIAESVACAGDLACLRSTPVGALLQVNHVGSYNATVDGDYLPDQPSVLFESGAFAHVPYLVGSNTDEGTFFLLEQPVVSDQAQLDGALRTFFGDVVGALVGIQYNTLNYWGLPPNPYQAAYARAVGDALIVCPTYDTAERVLVGGHTQLYAYNFDLPSATRTTFTWVPHTARS